MTFTEYLLYMFQHSWQFNFALLLFGTGALILGVHYTVAALAYLRNRFTIPT